MLWKIFHVLYILYSFQGYALRYIEVCFI